MNSPRGDAVHVPWRLRNDGQVATALQSHPEPTHSRRRRDDGNPLKLADPKEMGIA